MVNCNFLFNVCVGGVTTLHSFWKSFIGVMFPFFNYMNVWFQIQKPY